MEPKVSRTLVVSTSTNQNPTTIIPPHLQVVWTALIRKCETLTKILTILILTPRTISVGQKKKNTGELFTRNNKRQSPSRIPKYLKIDMKLANLWIEDLKKKIALKRLDKTSVHHI